jgi:hypothetical protein
MSKMYKIFRSCKVWCVSSKNEILLETSRITGELPYTRETKAEKAYLRNVVVNEITKRS